MPEQLLTILRLCLLALVYLFFLRVLRAVWTEVHGPRVRASAPSGARRGRKAKRGRGQVRREAGVDAVLTVLEPPDQRGLQYPVTGELTVGRAAGCQVTLDDTYASQIHARVFVHDGKLLVEDLGSTNGTYLNRQKVAGPMVVGPGDKLQIGNTIMELG
ncbi:MAG: FHA domain-containing protein [Actinomycetota bacterium]|nr:FHA domain-containing protein [Actinomycetota bacterium]